MKLPETWIELNIKNGDTYRLAYDQLGKLETKYQEFIEQTPAPGYYYAKDWILELDCVEGHTLVTPCSAIGNYVIMTQQIYENLYELNLEIRTIRKSVDPTDS